MTHICVAKLTIFGSNNGVSPGRRHAIIWTNAGILLIWPLRTNFNEMLITIHIFSVKKMQTMGVNGGIFFFFFFWGGGGGGWWIVFLEHVRSTRLCSWVFFSELMEWLHCCLCCCTIWHHNATTITSVPSQRGTHWGALNNQKQLHWCYQVLTIHIV